MKSFNFLLISILCLVVSGCSKDEPTPTAPSPYPNPDSNTVWEPTEVFFCSQYDRFGGVGTDNLPAGVTLSSDGRFLVQLFAYFNAQNNCYLGDDFFLKIESKDADQFLELYEYSVTDQEQIGTDTGYLSFFNWPIVYNDNGFDYLLRPIYVVLPRSGMYEFVARFYFPGSNRYFVTTPHLLTFPDSEKEGVTVVVL